MSEQLLPPYKLEWSIKYGDKFTINSSSVPIKGMDFQREFEGMQRCMADALDAFYRCYLPDERSTVEEF